MIASAAACLVVVVLYAAETALMSHLFRYGVHVPGADRRLRFVIAAVAIGQTCALYWLWQSLRTAARTPWTLLISCAVLLACISYAFAAPQGDVLGYIAYAKQPSLHDAYSVPPGYRPPPGFEAIHKAWPSLSNAPYGPLFLEVARVIAGPSPTLHLALALMRTIELVFLAAILLCFARLRPPPAITALAFVNPFLYFYYVYEAHNDAMALAFTMGVMVLASGLPIAAGVLAGGAGLVKAPFILLGLLAFAPQPASRFRTAGICMALIIAVGGSLFGGRAYLRSLTVHSNATYGLAHSTLAMLFSGIHIALALVAIFAIVAALASRRFNAAATFSFPAMSSFFYPWYLGWGMPYAASGSFAIPFFVLLPALGVAVDAEAGSRIFELVVLVAIIATARSFARTSAASPLQSAESRS